MNKNMSLDDLFCTWFEYRDINCKNEILMFFLESGADEYMLKGINVALDKFDTYEEFIEYMNERIN